MLLYISLLLLCYLALVLLAVAQRKISRDKKKIFHELSGLNDLLIRCEQWKALRNEKISEEEKSKELLSDVQITIPPEGYEAYMKKLETEDPLTYLYEIDRERLFP